MCGDPSSGGTPISRREFVSAAAAVVAGASIAPLAGADGSGADSLTSRSVDDPRVQHGPVTFPSGDTTIDGYLARPRAEGTSPGVVVLPGNWIIEPYIPEFAAQLAQAGFAALVVNVYHLLPKVRTWEEARAVPQDAVQKIMREQWTDATMLQDVRAGADWLRSQDFVSPKKIGITGFCGGGWNAVLFAADNPDLVAAVVTFYAPPDAAARFNRPRSVLSVIDKVAAPLQAHFGTRDSNIPMEDIERFRKAVAKREAKTEIHLYDAGHGFMAYNREPVYDPEDAKLALERATAFFHRWLH
jgi:carboxymethylenebutenolidase